MNASRLFAAAAFLVLSFTTSGSGLDIIVGNNTDGDPGSLRAAVLQANASAGNDTILFDPGLSGQFIGLTTGQLEVTDPDGLTIDGSGLAVPVSISGSFTSRVFSVPSGASLELISVVVTEGQAPHGADAADGGSPLDGDDGAHGGGIYNEGDLILRNTIVEVNCAGNGGKGGSKTVVSGENAGNGGDGGLGGGIFNSGAGATLLIENSTIRMNDAGLGGEGGGIDNGADGLPGSGGSGGMGGGIFNNFGELTIINSVVNSNQAGAGGVGGGYGNAGSGGPGGAGGHGGGIFTDDGNILLTTTAVWGNSAGSGGFGGNDVVNSLDTRGPGGNGGDGGGIFVSDFGPVAGAQIEGSLIQSNTAGDGRGGGTYPGLDPGQNGTDGGHGGSGGGIYVVGGNGSLWRMRNNTLTGNQAGDGGDGGDGTTGGTGGAAGDAGNGGGVAITKDGPNFFAVINHNTIVYNYGGAPGVPGDPSGASGADSSGGGVWETPGGINNPSTGIYLANSIVSLNDAGLNADIDDFLPEGNNLINVNPQLGPLGNHGGPTQTMPPLAGSPILNAGGSTADPLINDQRGFPRPLHGAPDLGAFEASLQPDARIGAKSNPATHRINNVYNPTGVGQSLPVRLRQMRSASYFVSAQNDGDVADNLRVTGTRANRTLRLTAYKLTGGRANITAQLAAGEGFPSVAPQEIVLIQFNVKARSKKFRAKQNLSCQVHSGQVSLFDTVIAKVKQTPPPKKRKRR